MTQPTFRPPVVPPLYPFGAPHPPGAFVVTRIFGDMSYPQHGAHDGLDIGNGRENDPIVAVAAGTVTYGQFKADAGGAAIVRIDHGDGWSSGYAHMNRIDVAVGQNVLAGAPLGILGSTGWVDGAHLHFDITLNGVRQDPWPLLQGDDMKIPAGTQVIAQGAIPSGTALRNAPAVADATFIRRVDAETQLAILWVMPGQGYYEKDGVRYRDWLAIALGDEVAYVAKEFVGNVFVTAAGQTLIPSVPAAPAADPDVARRVGLATTHLTEAATAIGAARDALVKP